jgi:hypothetical protein
MLYSTLTIIVKKKMHESGKIYKLETHFKGSISLPTYAKMRSGAAGIHGPAHMIVENLWLSPQPQVFVATEEDADAASRSGQYHVLYSEASIPFRV